MKITRCSWLVGVAALGLLISVVVAPPAARAQIVPVSLVHEVVADSKVPSGAAPAPLPPLPRNEARRAVREPMPKSFFLLSAGVYAAAALDSQQTESMMPRFHEIDPVVRPFLRLPAPAFYASAALFATGINFLVWKMARSERWHKIWWLPQLASAAGNMAGYGYTRARSATP